MFTRTNHASVRSGFTLVELMIVIMIISVMATFVLVALAGVTDRARADRTRTQIAKINELIMERWESYQYRAMPPTSYKIRFERNRDPSRRPSARGLAADRLAATYELLRMELPSTKGDVLAPARNLRDPITNSTYSSAISRAYQNMATSDWTIQFQGSECLYLILSQMRDRETSALAFFSDSEIGDTDGDGMNEILDGWGRPIEWLLWAPSHLSPLQVSRSMEPDQDDLFDPLKVGSSYSNSAYLASDRPRTLFPLIYSAGPDGDYGIVSGTIDDSNNQANGWAAVDNDPYQSDENTKMYRLGATSDPDAAADNISNHLFTTR